MEVKSKYPLTDQVELRSLSILLHVLDSSLTRFVSCHQGTSLRGKKVQLVLHWHIMPNAGAMIRGKMPLSEFTLPDTYTY